MRRYRGFSLNVVTQKRTQKCKPRRGLELSGWVIWRWGSKRVVKRKVERANCRVTESVSSMLCRAGLWSRREIKQNLTDTGQVMVGCGERHTYAHCGLSRASHFPALG